MISRITGLGKSGFQFMRVAFGAGMVHPVHPAALLALQRGMAAWGPTPATMTDFSSKAYRDEPAIIDHIGVLTFGMVEERTNQLAHAFAAAGIDANSRIAILCRDHRGFIEAYVATLKTGADALLLNTAFAGAQLVSVIEDQNVDVIVFDEEYLDMLGEGCADRVCFISLATSKKLPHPTLEEAMRGQSTKTPPTPADRSHSIILTSGTTGKPKGAKRREPKGLNDMMGVLGVIPYHRRSRTLICAPLFHAWGFGNFTAGSTMSATTIVSLRFDPEQALETIERERVTTLVVVPVMLQRILELPSEVRKKYDTSSLKLVVASGSAISGDLSTRFMDEFGDVLYNLYGSTEVAWATIATPKDMRAAPGTTGKPPLGTTLKIIDDQGNELPTGATGRVYVTHSMLFEGYTNGGNGDQLADMVGTGDLGHLDEHGRLFIDGRNDEMIISGGENVYPIEIEETISHHEYVVECAVIGVEDEKFGEGLNAFVVLRPDTELSEADLKAYVKQNLARFKVPRKVVFLDELPRNATGKVLKRDLRKL